MRQAKTVVPRPPPQFVERAELQGFLDTQSEPADRGRVVLVSAPVGHGKTVAVAEWVRASPELPTAWVSLDASDRDESQWWSSVLGAVAPYAAALGELLDGPPPTRWPEGPSPERTAFVAHALNALDTLPARVRLVLDDVHELVGHPAFDGLRDLLRHPIPQLTIVLCSRFDPPLGLDRLRLDGRLGTVRVGQLTFSTRDAARLFDHESIGLSESQIATLVERTEGWVAALRLAALSLQNSDDPAGFVRDFAGDDRSVADYLFGEVWATLDEHDREVLAAATIASPLPVALATALTGGPEAAERLEHLEATTGMVNATDRRRKYYRTHELMRSHVLARLRRHRPDRLSELYRLAAAWYDENGHALEALRCATDAGDVATTQTLLRARAVELMVRGEFAAVEQSEHVRGAADDPRVRLILGLVALERGDLERAEILLASADRELADVPVSDNVAVFRTVVQVRLAVARGRIADAVALAPTIAPELVEGAPLRALALVTRASGLSTTDAERSRADCEQALALIRERDWPHLRLQARTTLGLLRIYGGARPRTTEPARAAVDDASRRGWGRNPWVLRSRIVLGTAEVLRGQPHAARRILDETSLVSGHPQVSAAFEVLRGVVAHDTGDPWEGWRRMRHTRISTPPAVLADQQLALALLLEQEAALRLGRVREAAEVTRTGHLRLGDQAEATLLQARQDWVTGHDAPAVRALLAPLLAKQRPVLTALGVIEPVLLDAEIALSRHETPTVHRRLARALRLARRFDLLRPLVHSSAELRGYLAAQRGSFGDEDHLVDEILAVSRDHHPRESPTDALTERERAVLERLPTMRSAGEIADDLAVSLNTLKTHQRAIYQKLGVESRREAVTRARHIGLLEPGSGS